MSIVKPLSMATNSYLISVPSLYTSKTNSYATPSKPYNLNISCSYSSSTSLFSAIKKKSHSQAILPVISAQLEDDTNNTVVLEEEEDLKWENEEGDGYGEDGGSVEAIGDAAEGGVEEEVEYQEPSEDAKLFVGNLPFDVDSEKLAQLFDKAGVVEIAEVIYNRATDQSRGFGFVTMSTVAEAEKGVELFNRYDLNGRLLTVNKAAPRGSRPEREPRVFEPSFRIYVGNLPWDLDDARLEEVFKEFGKVVNAKVVYDRETGRSRGFGFVTMASESEMSQAIDNLDGQNLDGRTIRVNVAEERQRRI